MSLTMEQSHNLLMAVRAKAMEFTPDVGGIAIGRLDDPATWRVSFGPSVSEADAASYLAAIRAHDFFAPTADDVQAERKRRLALGFSYDFGDARGVHKIGTTPADMEGWRDVIDYANALIDSGDTTTQITIVTDTGTTAVTAPEWQIIMLTAASVRQKIWAASFALQALQPIPGNYADDSHWS